MLHILFHILAEGIVSYGRNLVKHPKQKIQYFASLEPKYSKIPPIKTSIFEMFNKKTHILDSRISRCIGVEIEREKVFRFGVIVGASARRLRAKNPRDFFHTDNGDEFLHIRPVAKVQGRLDNRALVKRIILFGPPDKIRMFFDKVLCGHGSMIALFSKIDYPHRSPPTRTSSPARRRSSAVSPCARATRMARSIDSISSLRSDSTR